MYRGWVFLGSGYVRRGWVCLGVPTPPFDMGPGIQRETVDKQVVSILNKCLNFEKKNEMDIKY